MKDLRVEPVAPDLFRLYRSYSVTLDSTDREVSELPGNPKHLLDLEILYDWPGLKGETRDHVFPVVLSKPVITPEAPPPIAQDLPGLDLAIVTQLYHAAPRGLAEVVTEAGGDLPAVRDLGSILVVTSLAIQDAVSHEATIAALRSQLPPAGSEDADRRIQLARAWEQRAALAFQALLHSRDPAVRTGTSLTAAHLGGRDRVDSTYVHGTLVKATELLAWLRGDCQRALHHYVAARRLLPTLGMRPFRQYMLERKVLELAKLDVLLNQKPDTSFIIEWIDHLLKTYTGRNRTITESLLRERQECRDLSRIQRLHPIIQDRVSRCEIATQALRQLEDRIHQELFR